MDYICSKKSFIKEKLHFSDIDTVWVCKFSVLTVPTISLKYFLNHKVNILCHYYFIQICLFFENSKIKPLIDLILSNCLECEP